MGRTVQDTSSTGQPRLGYGLGRTPRRAPSRPFSEEEEQDIINLICFDMQQLYEALPSYQHKPRIQRLIQEAIERKRASARANG